MNVFLILVLSFKQLSFVSQSIHLFTVTSLPQTRRKTKFILNVAIYFCFYTFFLYSRTRSNTKLKIDKSSNYIRKMYNCLQPRQHPDEWLPYSPLTSSGVCVFLSVRICSGIWRPQMICRPAGQ